MNNRIKVGDAYFELPGLAPSARQVVAEKLETPAMLDQGVFATAEPDAVARYLSGTQMTRPLSSTAATTAGPLDRMAAWRAFAGAKSPQPQQWADYAAGKAKHCGFNMAAFVAGFQWFLFNRMAGYALLIACAELTLAYITAGLVVAPRGSAEVFRFHPLLTWTIVMFTVALPRVIIAGFANIARYRHANRQIERIDRLPIDHERKLAMVAAAGSGNVTALLVFYVLIAIVKVIVANGQ